MHAILIVDKSSSVFFFLYMQSMWSLGFKALCIVINFFVLWSICFKNGPEYLIRRTAQVFIPLMRFLLQSLVLRSFLLLKYIFIFSFISACLIISVSNIPKFLKFFFSPSILKLSWFGSSVPSGVSFFPLFIMSIAHFSMLNSYCLYQSLQFFFIFGKYLYIIHVHKVINLFLWFL